MESQSLSGLGAVLALLSAALIGVLPRRMAMLPILIAVCFLPIGQSLQVFGLNFYLFRLVILSALVRCVIRGEARTVHWCRLDTLVFWWSAAFVVFGTLSHPGMASFITSAGVLYNTLGSYIAARCLLRDRRDFVLQIQCLAFMLVPLLMAMLLEKASGRNLFAVLGGVPEMTVIREGKLRAQGAFQHPILAGTFGATALPLVAGLLRARTPALRRSGAVGTASAVLVAWAAASSGAFLAAGGALVSLAVWRFRHSLRLVRVSLIVALFVLQAGMSRPVWWIFDSIGAITGGTGWHRSYIIDAAIRHFDEWWLVGTPVTVHWGGYPAPHGDPNNVDLTNQFIVEAVNGGVVRLGLFLAILWTCFVSVGKAFRAKRGTITPETEWLAWCTGIALLAHCICFFSVAYFDQMIFYLFWLFSAVAAGTMERGWLIRDKMAPKPKAEPQPEPERESHSEPERRADRGASAALLGPRKASPPPTRG